MKEEMSLTKILIIIFNLVILVVGLIFYPQSILVMSLMEYLELMLILDFMFCSMFTIFIKLLKW